MGDGVEKTYIIDRAHFDAAHAEGIEYFTYMHVPAKTPWDTTASDDASPFLSSENPYDMNFDGGDSAKGYNIPLETYLEDASPQLLQALQQDCAATDTSS